MGPPSGGMERNEGVGGVAMIGEMTPIDRVPRPQRGEYLGDFRMVCRLCGWGAFVLDEESGVIA